MAKPTVQILRGREVPLGGLRALTVRRTLPHRDRSFVGAWCFVDHYGPVDVGRGGADGMDVPPHPHTGLQTVSWLFAGEIEHRDSGGFHAFVRPGEVNLMTGGDGIAHSEVSTPVTTVLHGVQLWVALPDVARAMPRRFDHHAPTVVPLPGITEPAGNVRVFIGELPGVANSPVPTSTPLLGAELHIEPGARVDLAVDPSYEHGLLIDSGEVTWEGATLTNGDLGCLDPGPETLRFVAGGEPVRAILLGGRPFEEEIVMWWNFIGRTHDEIATWRAAWEAGDERFGVVPGYDGPVTRVPAPALPAVRLRPRGRRGRSADEFVRGCQSRVEESAVSEVVVTNNPAANRYEARLGGQLAGFAEYELTERVIVFTHTEVDDAFAGKGVGGALARGALDDVRADGSRRVKPVCEFMKGWIDKHPDDADLVREPE